MKRLEEIKNGMRSDIQEEWPSWEDIEWLIEQVEKLEKLENEVLLKGLRRLPGEKPKTDKNI